MTDLNFILVLSALSIMIFIIAMSIYAWFEYVKPIQKPLTKIVVNSLVTVSVFFLFFFALLFVASF